MPLCASYERFIGLMNVGMDQSHTDTASDISDYVLAMMPFPLGAGPNEEASPVRLAQL